MILGHGHPRVKKAVVDAVELGTSYGAPTVRESEIAEAVVAALPSIEKVRFVSSGTEATMSAVRLARGATGRDKIVKMRGHYHGHVDSLLVQAGSGATTLGHPNSPGVTAGAVVDTILCRFNDAEAVASAFRRFPGQIAAVLLEPVAGNMGLVPPEPGYLEALRELTTKEGALLIFDEVMTGFRLSYGGAQELYGITPDLTALGKIIGGGLPAAAYGALAEDHGQCLSGRSRFTRRARSPGNPLAMAAGLETLRIAPGRPSLRSSRGPHLPAVRGIGSGLSRCQRAARGPARWQHADPVLPRWPGARLRSGLSERHETFRPLFLGDACPGRVPALQPVRGGVRLHRAYRGRHRPYDRRRHRGHTGMHELIIEVPVAGMPVRSGTPLDQNAEPQRIRTFA